MLIRENENLIELPLIDANSRPIFVVYSDGDPQMNPNSYARMIPQCADHEIFTMPFEKQNMRGFPALFAISRTAAGHGLVLWPKPDKEYFAGFEFNPPRQRI